MSKIDNTSRDPYQPRLGLYIVGFLLSLGLTLAAYYLVTSHNYFGWGLMAGVAALAIVQCIVQLVFFLHLGVQKPRWRLGVFLFMLLVLLIIVVGSLWIMHNLNYRMTPEQMKSYMNSQQGL